MKRQSIAIAGLALTSSLMLAACQDQGGPAAGSAGTSAATAAGARSGMPGAATPNPSGTASSATNGSAHAGETDGSGAADGNGGGTTGATGTNIDNAGKPTGGGLSIQGLKSAPYPAMCNNPAGQLTNGKNMRGRDGNVAANMPGVAGYNPASAPVLADLNRDGRNELVVEFDCDAGGVTWPSVLVVYGQGWKILGKIDLGEVANKDHYYGKARVSSWSAVRGGVSLSWTASQGIDGSGSRRTGLLKIQNGRPVITNIQILTGHGAGESGGGDTSTGSALTVKNLQNAPYPAMCNNPAGKLTNGKDLRGNAGNVELSGRSMLLDMTGDGRHEMIVEFRCDAGGVTWPSQVVVYGAGWKVLGNKNLSSVIPEKATIAQWRASTSERGSVFALYADTMGGGIKWSGHISLKGGQLSIQAVDHVSDSGPAEVAAPVPADAAASSKETAAPESADTTQTAPAVG